MGWMTRVHFLAQVRDFSLLHIVQTFRGPYSLLSSGYCDSFPRVKRPGHEADHSPSSNAEINNGGYTYPLPHMSSCRENLYVLLHEIQEMEVDKRRMTCKEADHEKQTVCTCQLSL
jgi:hypothetical protein